MGFSRYSCMHDFSKYIYMNNQVVSIRKKFSSDTAHLKNRSNLNQSKKDIRQCIEFDYGASFLGKSFLTFPSL